MKKTVLARAKVNLWLEIKGQRTDGYHNLSSLVMFADIGDHVSLELFKDVPSPSQVPSGHLASKDKTAPLTVAGQFSSSVPIEGNLILKAWEALGAYPSTVKFHLKKNLPTAAGLGGGSADAAAILRLAAQFARLTPTEFLQKKGLDMGKIARLLGADVPVCLAEKTCVMSGIGDHIEHLDGWPQMPAILVNPGIGLSTQKVFAAYAKSSRHTANGKERQSPSAPPSPIPNGSKARSNLYQKKAAAFPKTQADLITVLKTHKNDLEAPASVIAPEIKPVISEIEAQSGCQLARLSGSGATCFGLFHSHRAAQAATDHLAQAHPGWWVRFCVLGDT